MEVNKDALTEIIERTGYPSRAAFASKVGISPSYLTEMMKGDKPGSPEVIKKMADELRCPISALIKHPDDLAAPSNSRGAA